ncbi:LuxR C-terminal-related transcriptional regulator [Geminicoccaceae bacterium 1502E]|nr:LuxR C-terminal-related transcriptional regulator [Geminicoccaceae bacterium 1502E]
MAALENRQEAAPPEERLLPPRKAAAREAALPGEELDSLLEAGLSPRELEIARLVALGHPNKRVARILEISPWTVAAYLQRAYAKLGVHCRAAMVARLLARDKLRL